MESDISWRVMIAEACTFRRFGMAMLVQRHPHAIVCGAARDVPEARRLCAEERPDVVLLGPGLRRGLGLDLVSELPRLHEKVRVVVILERLDEALLRRTLRAGALGVGTTEDSVEELLAGLDAVCRGLVWASRAADQSLLAAMRTGTVRRLDVAMESLSNRELGVFQMLGSGMGPMAISRDLGVAVKTVETHLAHIREKLGADTAAELRRIALLHAEEPLPRK